MLLNHENVETILSALGEQLENLAKKPLELLVCGGSALNVLGFVQRATKDVDVLAYIDRDKRGNVSFIKASPLNAELTDAANRVARDFDLPDGWLNAGPASAVDTGLPEGLIERVTTRKYGQKLIICFLGRYDQIHFKLCAAVDQGAGKHFDDLRALNPNADEIEQAARWSMKIDVSEGYRQVLKDMLNNMGYSDVVERL